MSSGAKGVGDRKALEDNVAQLLYKVDAYEYGGHSAEIPPPTWGTLSPSEQRSYKRQAEETVSYLKYLGLLRF